MKLFHGSNMKVEVIDLAKSRPGRTLDELSIFPLRSNRQRKWRNSKWKRSVVTWWLIALNLMILLLMG